MAFKTILIKGHNYSIRKEGVAGGAITPGDLIDASDRTSVVVHATPGGNAQKAFAVENDVVANEIDTAYAEDDTVLFAIACRGAEVYANVAAAADAISKGDALESAGDGTLQKHTAGSADGGNGMIYLDAVVAYALEAVDNSGGASEARIQVEVA